jgi:hypothetical protein
MCYLCIEGMFTDEGSESEWNEINPPPLFHEKILAKIAR